MELKNEKKDKNEKKAPTVDQFVNDEVYKDLPKNENLIAFYKEIEQYKGANPSLSTEEILQHFDDSFNVQSGISTFITYDEAKATWMELTYSEKMLVIHYPGYAAMVDSARTKAYDYTMQYYGHSGQGDISDAFRHSLWNALMCKYASKAMAEAFATAHEDKDDAYYSKVFEDGFTGRAHTYMDLHNNQVGRDCWNVLTDSTFWVSDSDLIGRIFTKIRSGQMVTLHS